jgi:hypothetical protein
LNEFFKSGFTLVAYVSFSLNLQAQSNEIMMENGLIANRNKKLEKPVSYWLYIITILASSYAFFSSFRKERCWVVNKNQ